MKDKLVRILFLEGDPKKALSELSNLGVSDEYDSFKAYALLLVDDIKGAERVLKHTNTPLEKLVKALIDLRKGCIGEAMVLLEKVVSEAQESFLKLEALYQLARSKYITGDVESAKLLADDLLELSLKSNFFVYKAFAEGLLGLISISSGEFVEGLNLIRKANRYMELYGNKHRLALFLLLEAYHEAYLGNREHAYETLEKANELSMDLGSPYIKGRYYETKFVVDALFGKGDVSDLRRAIQLAEISQDVLFIVEVGLDYVSELISLGSFEEAEKHIGNLERNIRHSGLVGKLSHLNFLKATLMYHAGRYDESLRILERIISDYPEKKGLLVFSHILASLVRYSKGEVELSLKEIEEAIRITEQYKLYSLWNPKLNEDLFHLKGIMEVYARRQGKLPDFLKHFCYLIGLKVGRLDLRSKEAVKYMLENSSKVISILKHPKVQKLAHFRIYALGNFRMFVFQRPITDRDFERPTHLKLFKYLLINRNRKLPKERIIYDLFGEREISKARNALNVSVSYLRRLVGEYIDSTRTHIAFIPKENMYIDLEEFESKLLEGLREGNESKLRRAISIYSGDLLSEDAYEPWMEEERVRLRQLYIRGILVLSEMLYRKGEIHRAIAYLEDALFRYVEPEIYEYLMEILKTQRNSERMSFWKNYVESKLN